MVLYGQGTESTPWLLKLPIFCSVCSGLLYKVDFESLPGKLLTLARAIPKAQFGEGQKQNGLLAVEVKLSKRKVVAMLLLRKCSATVALITAIVLLSSAGLGQAKIHTFLVGKILGKDEQRRTCWKRCTLENLASFSAIWYFCLSFNLTSSDSKSWKVCKHAWGRYSSWKSPKMAKSNFQMNGIF